MQWVRSGLLIIVAVTQVLFALAPGLVGIEGSIGDMANANRTILVPAGMAFSIWLFLYIGGVYVALWHLIRPGKPWVARVGFLAFLAFAGNSVWALHQPVFGPDLVSFLILEFILVAAVLAGVAGRQDPEPTTMNRVAYGCLLALGGWITVASPGGLSLAFGQAGMWPLFDDALAGASIILTVWALLAAAVAYSVHSYAYLVPVLWGLFWVGQVNQDKPQLLLALIAAATFLLLVTVVSKARLPKAER
ncbi:MAG: hypothetical protein HRU11_08530 [Parvularculaceae bacterium]|nr:hypothetical protein [Parvularculaceae bacterium]